MGLVVDQLMFFVDDVLRLKFSATASGSALGIVSARFPMLNVNHRSVGPATGELVLPRGNLGIKCRECRGYQAMYPGIYQTMPWFGALKGTSGLYVGAHDPAGSMKRVVASGPGGPGASYFEIYPEESGAVGNSIAPDWFFEIAPICAERGWPAIAHQYKSWVTTSTDWGRAPKLIDRHDIPRELRDGAWWFVHSIVPEGGIDLLEQGTDRLRKGFEGLPTIHHWYEWHTPGMDRGFPSHWPKIGTKEAISRLQADGKTKILLYTNATHTDQSSAPLESGRPVCPNGASQYPLYWRDTLQRADGSRVFIVPSSRACLAAMDHSSANWRSVVIANSDRVTNDLGAAGLYLDVLGNVSEGSWFSITNPPGRGNWVTRTARDLVGAISQRPQFVVVEGALEQMSGITAAGVNYLGTTVEMVPLFPLVYHERFILAGMVSRPPDDRDALRIKNGLGFAWGLQLGLSSLQWHERHGPFNVKQARDLTLSRRRLANWVAYGEYLGPVEQVDDNSRRSVESKSWGSFVDNLPPSSFRRNSVEASLFRGADGNTSIIAINLREDQVTTRLMLPPPFDEAGVRLERSQESESAEDVIFPNAGIVELRLSAGEILRATIGIENEAKLNPVPADN